MQTTHHSLLISSAIILILIGFSFSAFSSGLSAQAQTGTSVSNALADSSDTCVTCHRDTTPGIYEQFGRSTMAGMGISCRNCHEVAGDYPDAVAHEGTYVLASPTPAKCGMCHSQKVAEFNQSRHSAPAYAAVKGLEDFSEAQMAIYQAIPEGSYNPDKTRNALYGIEGPEVTQLACIPCHSIGEPRADGSIGRCQKCHLRHEFSLVQARKPETCNNCHIGPDHPQWEIFEESSHGIATMTMGDGYNWSADPGTLTVVDFPAPNCATCHISGFGAAEGTHDVGERLTWYLFAPKSDRRPSWEENQIRMQTVCLECHNGQFVSDFYANGDALVVEVNSWVAEAESIVNTLTAAGYMTATPFDEPMDFVYFDLWHHYGRTAKFGGWMQGADYTQWHGAYEMLKDMADLREFARTHLDPSQYPLTSAPVSSVQ